MTMHFAEIAHQATLDGVIDADELLALRRAGWANGQITPDEAEALFSINAALVAPDAVWTDFFVETIGEYVVNGTPPRGHVSPDNATWLLHRIEQDGKLCSMAELELLVRVLERSQNCPQLLKDRALFHVEQAVLTGAGPTRHAGDLEPGRITAGEAQILRRTLFAAGGDAPAAISRAEAELLFRLKDATLTAPNAPEWQTLFVQGVANYLQGAVLPNAQISRDRAAELDAFMADSRSSVGGFLGKMALATPRVFEVLFHKDAPARDRFAELSAAERVTGEEQAWLEAEMAEDGQTDAYEQALLRFLAEG